MKPNYILALILIFVSLVDAIPVIQKGGRKVNSGAKKRVAHRAASPASLRSTSSRGSSQPRTPTPDRIHNVPLPGRSAPFYDPKTKVITAFYGDDTMPRHMAHVQRNQGLFPGNTKPMPMEPTGSTEQRKDALKGIPPAPPLPSLEKDKLGERVKDEKLPNSVKNLRHAETTTVQYLPQYESRLEGALMSQTRKLWVDHGKKPRVQLRPNQGWLPLDRKQRVAHEAPAVLPSARIPPRVKEKSKSNPTKGGSKHSTKKQRVTKKSLKGGSPMKEAKAKTAAKKPGRAAKQKKGVQAQKDKVNDEKTKEEARLARLDLQRKKFGRRQKQHMAKHHELLPAGHVWKSPGATSQKASHAGAPLPPTNSHLRRPPRPQNRDGHLKDLRTPKPAPGSKKQMPSRSKVGTSAEAPW